MSSRILSAYFNDHRQGKKQRSEIRDYLIAEVQKDPLRFGHLMSGLDQAQYEHPIPVTDFLLLRKEVEASLNDDEQTMFVPHPSPASTPEKPSNSSQDADTLLAGVSTEHDQSPVSHDAETLAAFGDEVTVVPGETRRSIEREDSFNGSQLSDGVREVEVPTIITKTSSPVIEPKPTRQGANTDHNKSIWPLPLWGWMAGGILVTGLVWAIWSQRPMAPEMGLYTEKEVERAREEPTIEPQALEQKTIEAHPVALSAETSQARNHLPAEQENKAEPIQSAPIEEPMPHWNANQWLDKMKQRADLGYLLPESDNRNAFVLLHQLQQRFPNSEQALEARRYLKNAYLQQAETTRNNGEWDQSQQYLDAAFNIVKPQTSNNQASSSDGF